MSEAGVQSIRRVQEVLPVLEELGIGCAVQSIGPWIVPIPGTTKLARLEENLGAVEVELSAAEVRAIDAAASAVQVQGARYPPQFQARVGK